MLFIFFSSFKVSAGISKTIFNKLSISLNLFFTFKQVSSLFKYNIAIFPKDSIIVISDTLTIKSSPLHFWNLMKKSCCLVFNFNLLFLYNIILLKNVSPICLKIQKALFQSYHHIHQRLYERLEKHRAFMLVIAFRFRFRFRFRI